MHLGNLLLARELITEDGIDQAVEHQNQERCSFIDSVIALNLVAEEQMRAILLDVPHAPLNIEDTGLPEASLLNLLIKTMFVTSFEYPSEISGATKLTSGVVAPLLKDATNRGLIEILGSHADRVELRHSLTEAGRKWALEALNQNQYTGPAPIPIELFAERILMQSIGNERIDRDTIDVHFKDMIVTDEFIRRLGPAINSGRCILLYGPPGNGKTSVAERVGRMFRDIIYIPYAVQVEGQIIKVYDPSVHIEAAQTPDAIMQGKSLRRAHFDGRFVACKRPIVITGGELTLEMLDLQYIEQAGFYEAPLHIKALGGTFIIDDFGRQIVSPEDLLNRWIVPLQSRVDFLKLHTGKSFSIPFDELIIFSTNLEPADLMDPAFLRRIPYKLETTGPTREDYCQIFHAVAANRGIAVSDEILIFIIEQIEQKLKAPLACYQPVFIIDQIISACKYDGVDLQFTREMAEDALSNLFARRADPTVAR